MTIKVRVRKRAKADIEDAAKWYEAQQAGLGSQFLDEIQKAFSRISEFPDLYPSVGRNTRRCLIQKFPFGVFYRTQPVADNGGSIVIVAVMHASRAPQSWQVRS